MGAQEFSLLEYGFTVFFMLECGIRLRLQGVAFFKEWGNVFDCLLAGMSFLDMFILQMFKDQSCRALLPLFRLLRLSRVLRITRLFRIVRELELIVEAFFKSSGAVVWICGLLFILNYICAIVLTQTVGHHAKIWSESHDQQDVQNLFGDVFISMKTLFVIMTMDGWAIIAETMSEHINPTIVYLLMMSYIMLSAYTMMSMVTGCISEALITQQQQTTQRKLKELEAGKEKLFNDLRDLWKSLDEDNSGTLDYNEVHEAFSHNPDLLKNLALHDVHVDMQALEDLHARLQGSNGVVAIDTYVEALSKMTGNASASSVFDLKHMMMILQSEYSLECKEIRDKFDMVVDVVQNCCSQRTDDSDVMTRVQGELSALGFKLDALTLRCQELVSHQQVLATQQKASQQDLMSRLDSFIIQHTTFETKINQRLDVLASRQQDQHLSMTAKLDALIEHLVEPHQKRPFQRAVDIKLEESRSRLFENFKRSRSSGLIERCKQDARMDSPFAPRVFPSE